MSRQLGFTAGVFFIVLCGSARARAIECPDRVAFAAMSERAQWALLYRVSTRIPLLTDLARSSVHPYVRAVGARLLLRAAAYREAGVVLASGAVTVDEQWPLAATLLGAARGTPAAVAAIDAWRASGRVHPPVLHFLAFQLRLARVEAPAVIAALEEALRTAAWPVPWYLP